MITCACIPMMFLMLFVGENASPLSFIKYPISDFYDYFYKYIISTSGKDEEPRRTHAVYTSTSVHAVYALLFQ